MKRTASALTVALICILATWSTADAQGPTTRQWNVGGVTREALVFVPPAAKDVPTPIIFAFHGRGGTMQAFARLGFERFWPEAIVVYPQALRTPGLVKDLEGKQFAWQSRVGMADDRDLKLFDAMLESLEHDYKIDLRRVYVAGHSNGGQFTYLLWQTRGQRIAAFAAGSAALSSIILKPEAPDPQSLDLPLRPVLHIVGRNDPDDFSFQQRTIEIVRRTNHCTDKGESDGERTTYPSPDGAPVVTWLHSGGHPLPTEAPQVIVRFFKQFELASTAGP